MDAGGTTHRRVARCSILENEGEYLRFLMDRETWIFIYRVHANEYQGFKLVCFLHGVQYNNNK